MRLSQAVLDAIATCWGREPIVLRSAVAVDTLPQAAMLEAVRSGREHLKVRLGSREVADFDSRILPVPSENDFSAWLPRLATLGDDLYCLHRHINLGSDEMWRATTRLLFDLYGRFGIPFGGMFATAFFGSYRQTPIGVHKDGGHTIIIAVHGPKRMLLWPHHALLRHVDEPEQAGEFVSHTLSVPFADVRESAIVLDAQPGDLIYWPPSYWHCAESSGELSATLNFACYPNPFQTSSNPFMMAARATERVDFSTLHTPHTLPFGVSRDHTRSANAAADQLLDLATRVLATDEIHDEYLRWHSSFGMVPYPDASADINIDVTDTIEIDLPCRLLVRERRNGQLAVAAGGHVLECERAFMPLLERLQQVGSLRVSDLLDDQTQTLASGEVIELLELLAGRRAFAVRKRAS
jgi:hypothetical protein